MILTAHQPVYLPWLGLFHKIALADRYVCYDHVDHSSYDYTAKNQVNSANGPVQLVVPLKRHHGQAQALMDVQIENATPWQKKHHKALCLSYSKAPFFAQYEPWLAGFYATRWTHITPMNNALLHWLLQQLGIPREIELSSRLGLTGAKSDAALDMSRKLGAQALIFGTQGRDYADLPSFQAAGIAPIFQSYQHPQYTQVHGRQFSSHLSVLDLLFNAGPRSLEILMSGNLSREQLEAELECLV
jgi:hypothetical protein